LARSNIIVKSMRCMNDTPPNSSKDPKVGPWRKQRKKNWSMLYNSQHFEGRRACWSSRMGLGWTCKQEFKMRSICTTKKKGG
jgi:hypothetical protein